jgi:menaquinone-specific isochorismate synthase
MNQLATEAMAGTIRRGGDEKEDLTLAYELSSSVKNIEEHNIVCEDLENKLSVVCGNKWKKISSNRILQLKHLQHIYSQYLGEVDKTKKNHVFNLLKLFHPTPAVAGFPCETSLELLHSLVSESQRGFYSAPVGMISRDKQEFAVGIRSAYFEENRVRVFGGAGIVPLSIAKNEWQEIDTKIGNLLRYLKCEV